MRTSVTIMGISLLLLIIFAQAIHAEIVVYDRITALKRPVMLKALTKGRFFPRGGTLVDFFVDGKHIGKRLSGGDGYAFFKYLPKRFGVRTVKVKSRDESGEGMLLVTKKNEKVLLLEIEGGIMQSRLSREPKQGSTKAIKKSMAKYRIIYVTTMLGINRSRKWLEQAALPLSVIVRWTGAELLDELRGLGIRLIAVVGSASLISEASEHIKKRYSFDDTEDGIVVEDWEDLSRKLKVQ